MYQINFICNMIYSITGKDLDEIRDIIQHCSGTPVTDQNAVVSQEKSALNLEIRKGM